MRYRGFDNEYFVYETTVSLDVAPSGTIRGYNIVLFNLLTAKNIYTRNFNNVRKYRNYMSMINVYYFEYDINTNIFQVFIYIYEKSHLIVHSDLDVWYDNAMAHHTAAEKDKLSLEKFKKALKSGHADFTLHISGSFFTKDNSCEELTLAGKTITLNDGNQVFGIIRNSDTGTDRNSAYYFTEAGKNSATGLLNKRAVTEFSKDILAENPSGKLFMIVIDIDDFKNINDSYGHLFGDDVILTVARVLSNSVNIRGIVGRIGGDEFFVLTENIDSEKDLRILLKTIYKNVYSAYDNKLEDFHISLSTGISCYPDDGTDYDTLFRKADKALYIAKEKGKSRYIIYKEDRHGSLPDNNSEAAEKHSPALKTGISANSVSDLIITLNREGCSSVDMILSEICRQFSIEGIHIVSAACDDTGHHNILYSVGDCSNSEYNTFSFIELPEYLKFYNELSIYAENNIQNTIKYSQTFYDKLKSADIISFLHIAYPSAASPKLFIFFDIFKIRRKWSDDEKHFLLILCRLMLEVICREKGL